MNQFGRYLRLSIYGESHGKGVGVIIDGVPAGIPVDISDFEFDISRRKPQIPGGTSRLEEDQPEIISGLYRGLTNGAPLNIYFENQNIKSADYDSLKNIPRPGHADFVAYHKFHGFHDQSGGGHFSGRLTLAFVAAGVICKKIIKPISIDASIVEIGGQFDYLDILNKAKEDGDSLGGIVACRAEKIPIGLGEPFFDSIESLISHLAFSIPAVKGIEFGSGFAASRMKGSKHNDEIMSVDGTTSSNHSGGINGGITNGNPIVFRVAIKPTSSISKEQISINLGTQQNEKLIIKGRHDVCIALRVPVVIEAITAIALAECLIANQRLESLKFD
ncbi:MAG: chorismate synthase [Bacteroidota bacterium]|nr:chorismate synthase [Bacteroidota bacterium]